MSLLTPDSGLLFWMVIVFGIVFVILAKYGFPVITRMVDERKKYIEKSLKPMSNWLILKQTVK